MYDVVQAARASGQVKPLKPAANPQYKWMMPSRLPGPRFHASQSGPDPAGAGTRPETLNTIVCGLCKAEEKPSLVSHGRGGRRSSARE